ncbi:hypothetical protein JRO89_XS05G0242000 [Xanthoceras sorbifolium]|uniref:DUF4228 domain protein n=1 Tax=Xanthoceras sorbifolium TaxID=99658 RepID=A0ABQ8I3C4_9ROSI|nr:hypothetical protein JRO89_XS05G0242000 [Xanthoceras sorbifolium]
MLTMKGNKAVRVVLPGGEIRQFRELVKAAELMLECPNFFLTNSRSLHIGRRFSALAADEELEPGNVYIMFPMKRVNSMVSAADLAALFMAANSSSSSSAKRLLGGAGGVGPSGEITRADQNDEDKGSSVSLEVDEGFPIPEFKYRVVSWRSRKPLLETINEEPVFTR